MLKSGQASYIDGGPRVGSRSPLGHIASATYGLNSAIYQLRHTPQRALQLTRVLSWWVSYPTLACSMYSRLSQTYFYHRVAYVPCRRDCVATTEVTELVSAQPMWFHVSTTATAFLQFAHLPASTLAPPKSCTQQQRCCSISGHVIFGYLSQEEPTTKYRSIFWITKWSLYSRNKRPLIQCNFRDLEIVINHPYSCYLLVTSQFVLQQPSVDVLLVLKMLLVKFSARTIKNKNKILQIRRFTNKNYTMCISVNLNGSLHL